MVRGVQVDWMLKKLIEIGIEYRWLRHLSLKLLGLGRFDLSQEAMRCQVLAIVHLLPNFLKDIIIRNIYTGFIYSRCRLSIIDVMLLVLFLRIFNYYILIMLIYNSTLILWSTYLES